MHADPEDPTTSRPVPEAVAPSLARAMVAATAPSIGLTLPTLLVGTLAVRLRADLGFDEAALGFAIASARVAAAVASAPMGRLAERAGPVLGLRSGAVAASAVMLGIALFTTSWSTLVPFIVLAGVMTAMAMASADLWLTRVVITGRQGLAFGVKQAAPPAAALMAGLAVPSLAVTLGWRWTFAVAGVVAVLGAFAVPRDSSGGGRERVDRRGDVPMGLMILLAAGHGLGAGGAAALTAFLVSSAVASGIAESSAGTLFAVGAALAITTRIIVGHLADRGRSGQLLIVAAMLATGALAYLLLASGNRTAFILAAPVAFAAGWGWPGLFVLSMVRANPNAPAAGAAITRTGGFLGGIAGPVVFGILARHSYGTAWLAVATWTLVGAGTIVMGRRLVLRERSNRHR